MDTAEAYRACEEITWSQARNFAYGIRLLPAGKRHAVAALYAFARRIDDIGDGTMPPRAKLAALEEARDEVLGTTRLGAPGVPGGAEDDPVLVALNNAGKQFAIPIQAFGELIDGCVADVNGTFYATFDDLRYYCRCVSRVHRAAVPRRLRRARHAGGRTAGRLARGGPAAHEHPPGHP